MNSSILLIEDDEFKEKRVRSCIENTGCVVEIATSVKSAVNALQEKEFDFILLDMALPSHDATRGGGSSTSMPSGGMEVIMELSYMARSDRVIVITQYPEVEIEGRLIPIAKVAEELASQFSASISAVIFYKNDSNEWATALTLALGTQ